MRALLLLFIYINSGFVAAFGQAIEHRLIVFGDAGEINNGQRLSIQKAVELLIPNKTSIYFLGDNIYPYGMGLDSNSRLETIKILESQYSPFVEKNTPITFVAGNHDWDKSRSLGLAKVKAQEEFLQSRNIPNLKFVPKAGTSAIYTEDISNEAKILIYDSEYWLFPHHANPDSALSTELRNEFLGAIGKELNQNKDKTVFIFSHHPMYSFGEHGKNITWKDHIFPLTRVNKNLYIPLPILGSLYPLFRTKIFNSAEDISHPLYRNLKNDITALTKQYKNVVFVAGHDHGLQLIQDDNRTQIVTGSGAKRSFIAKHNTQKFVSNKQGFCTIDCLVNGELVISFFTVLDNQVDKNYEITIPKLK